MLELRQRDLLRLANRLDELPVILRATTAKALDELAFVTRNNAISLLRSKLKIRNERFVFGSIRVLKASKSRPISQQDSIVGSIARPRFSGLVEQETGSPTTRTRVATLLARGRSRAQTIRPSFRMRGTFITPEESQGANQSIRVAKMLGKLRRSKHRRPFIIRRDRVWRPGLYKLQRGKARLLQYFRSPRLQPKRFRWLTLATDKTIELARLDGIWLRALRRILR